MLGFFSFAFADYGSLILEANGKYETGDYLMALELYKQAYAQKPGQKLADLIQKLEKQIVSRTNEPLDPKADWAKEQNILIINTIPFAYGNIMISYKRSLIPNCSLGFTMIYGRQSSSDTSLAGSSYGFGLDLDSYLDNKWLNGIYAGFGLNFIAINTETHISYSNYYVNVHLGYRWIFGWGGVIEIQIGYPFMATYEGFNPIFQGTNLSFGYAF